MNMSREQVERKLADLRAQHEQAKANANMYLGAVLAYEALLKDMDAPEPEPATAPLIVVPGGKNGETA